MKKITSLIIAGLSALLICQVAVAAKKVELKHHHHHAAQMQTAKVDINTADATQLASLKGIGPSRAAKIVAYRKANGRFASVNDLTKVKGIGPVFVKRLINNNPGRIRVDSK